MKTMLSAFRTTVSRGGEKPSYEMVFKFASMEDMHTADHEWHAYRAALASTPQPAAAETIELAVAAERERCAKIVENADLAIGIGTNLRPALAASIRQSAKGGE
ncbi:hypothetical protein HRJ34_15340 [Rhizorhabdus wittichii]|uniref:Uncharacterized protein n=1 Tax=Rhizorhabdus wittichii TaxID=160791 RepID=A0A975CYP6_9SPHN|nr:hypothetical protein [Rhizorhabdus wittichii]QTH19742.1 hypothetical protein HRJ34_15340 [Rhizorhabdus wittichii]